MKLTMGHFLRVVREYKMEAREVLLSEGFHAGAILAKAEKAARLGYTDFGVVADRPWLTPVGAEFLNKADTK